MFTAAAFIAVAVIAWAANQSRDREAKARPPGQVFDDDLSIRLAILHARQDLRLIAYLLAGVIVALGIVADRIR